MGCKIDSFIYLQYNIVIRLKCNHPFNGDGKSNGEMEEVRTGDGERLGKREQRGQNIRGKYRMNLSSRPGNSGQRAGGSCEKEPREWHMREWVHSDVHDGVLHCIGGILGGTERLALPVGFLQIQFHKHVLRRGGHRCNGAHHMLAMASIRWRGCAAYAHPPVSHDRRGST